MKKLSKTLTELGIDFTFPIEIRDSNGKLTYYEDSDDYWERFERDSKGRPLYHENSDDYWQKWERDANGDVDYYEMRTGVKKGTPKSSKQ